MKKIEVQIDGPAVNLIAPGDVSATDMVHAAFIVLSGAAVAAARCDCEGCRGTRRVVQRLKAEILDEFGGIVIGDPSPTQPIGRA